MSVLFFFTSCTEKGEKADLIIRNAEIYTVNESAPWAEALAIKNGLILAAGDEQSMAQYTGQDTRVIDAKGHFVMPGFIEGHGHFSGLGSSLMNLNFLKSRNWDDIVTLVGERVKTAKPGEWIIGRGWHQEKWEDTPDRQISGYPFHDALSAVSPENPVKLDHASGHAVFANKLAMNLAGVSVETPDPLGGHIVRDGNGEAIGVFEENAENIIEAVYQEYLGSLSSAEKQESWMQGIRLAQAECLRHGITSFQDAGSSYREISIFEGLAEQGVLNVRLWAMVRHNYETLKQNIDALPIVNAGNGFFTSRSIKAAIDGALGSYGAWLLEPYEDKEDFTGQNVMPLSELKDIAALAAGKDLQLCIHAIGDRGNREVLDLFEKATAGKKDHRWRIEHAQHLNPLDIPRFQQLGVIAAMQGIHCTSDAPYVEKRLGVQRAKEGAYAWRSLLDSGAIIANGTDAPVEDISPIESFYASVTRMRTDNGMLFYPEQKMSREEALYSYTLANAFAAFEEQHKGSLESGKYADLIVLSDNLVTCSDQEILETSVLLTLVGGNIAYQSASWEME